MSNSDSFFKFQQDSKQSPFLSKGKQPFISMIKQIIKMKTTSPSNLSQEQSISYIKTKMKSRIGLHSHKASLSNIISNNYRKDVISPVRALKSLKPKNSNEAVSKDVPNSLEFVIPQAGELTNKDETPLISPIAKCSSYSDISSISNASKLQRLDMKLTENLKENKLDDNCRQNNFKKQFDIYINIFDEAIKLTNKTEQKILQKIKSGIEQCFINMENKQKEKEDEVSLYKQEAKHNKRLCDKYCSILKDYQKKTQETDYKIQFNNHLLIDDQEYTENGNSLHVYDNKKYIINNQSPVCSRNQSFPVNNSNISKEISTNELESICFADKVTMVKMNSIHNIPKLNFKKCINESNMNLEHNQKGVK